MAGDDAGLTDFVEQEESSVMESPKRESSEWTDEKHSLYLKSMEASFVDQLYSSLDMKSWQTQNERSSDTMSSRRINASTRNTSGQFKVLQHGFWSRIDFKRENGTKNGADDAERAHASSKNPWIQHFRNGTKNGASPQQKSILTLKPQQFHVSDSKSNAEVMDQNFVEDSAIEKENMLCSKKRKSTSEVSKSANNQAASIWHISCNRNRG